MLRRAVQSVANQTMKDYVHVIVNDAGDPNGVESVISEFPDEVRRRILLIHNAESHGMEAASNVGIKSSKSTYIAIHDDDDTWHPEFLAQSVRRLEENGMKGVVVHTEQIIERINDDDTITEISRERFNPEIREINFYDTFMRNYATPITFLFRREVFETIGLYDEYLRVCGDWDFTLRFIRHWDIDYLDSDFALAYYHLRPDATGVNGNTVISGFDKHRYFTNYLANKYLREDLDAGALGMGYMFNLRRRENEVRIVQRDQHDTDKKDEFDRISSVSERVNGIARHVDAIEGLLREIQRTQDNTLLNRASHHSRKLLHKLRNR